MKKIKDLSVKEIKKICEANDENCTKCPLLLQARIGKIYCLKTIDEVPFWLVENTYEKFNENIEVDKYE